MRVDGIPFAISAVMRLRRVVRERRIPGSSKEESRSLNVVCEQRSAEAEEVIGNGYGGRDATDALTHDIVPPRYAHPKVLLYEYQYRSWE
jgi:hypothetical protein